MAHRSLPSWSFKEPWSFADRVLKWADENLSDFPWRQRRTPYEVLIAELLLKRTTATAAARVYEDFLLKFPSLQHIVSASDEELIQALSSVGLQYQRARFVKKLATWILSKHGGCLPGDLKELLEVPGLGNYSATAILSFGYGIPAAVLDTNVERILLRVFRDTLPPRPSWTLLRKVATSLLPKDSHRRYNYGLLDLGRLICRYSEPRCGECPLSSGCTHYSRSRGKGPYPSEESNATLPQKNLRVIRHYRGLSLKQLAQAANVSKLTIIRIESGRTSPRRETLGKLAQALDVLPEDLSD